MGVSGRQVEDFYEHGFVVLEALIGGDDLAELRGAYDEIIRGDVDCGADGGERVHAVRARLPS